MKALRGLATGLGSFPQKEPEEALDLIFRYFPQVPFWPQLPKRNLREGMIAQFSDKLPFLSIGPDGLKFSSLDAEDGELETFYEQIIANDVDYFKIGEDFSAGLYAFYRRLEKADLSKVEFIKCQITGPFSFCAGINDEKGITLLHDGVFRQSALKGLIMKALWQIKLFRKFGKKIVLFIDEPYLGCFGSAYTPINKEDVVSGLTELTAAIKSQDVLIGVHCCGNTDWSIFTDIKSIDIINFDAFSFTERFVLYADNLKGFIKRGGILCWGVVPTQEFSGKETPELLIGKIEQGIGVLVKKGVDRELLRQNLLISPACGLGTLDADKSAQILRLLSDTSALIQKS